MSFLKAQLGQIVISVVLLIVARSLCTCKKYAKHKIFASQFFLNKTEICLFSHYQRVT
jgi:hypothetical protein